MYSILVIPLRIGFDVNVAFTSSIFIFECVIDCLFATDMILNFFTGYYDETETLVANRRKIALHYLRGWFLIDLLSTVPIDVLVEITVGGGDNLASLRLVRILRLARLLKLARLSKLSKIMHSVEEALDLNQSAFKLVRLLFDLLFAAHLLACGWWYVGRNSQNSGENWIETFRMQEAPLFTKYVSSLYWSVATMTAVGYGDFSAKNDIERIYSIFTQLVGAAVFGFLIGNISTLLETIDVRHAKFKRKMGELRDYMIDRKLPAELQHKIKVYYEQYLNKKSVFEEQAILSELSHTLRNKVVLHGNKDLFTNIEVFSGRDPSFVTAVVLRMKPVVVGAQEIIAHQGEIAQEMYFLLRGVVDVFFLQDNKDIFLGSLNNGAHFGEISLLKRSPRTATVRTRRSCECYSVSKEHADKILAHFPSAKEELLSLANERIKKVEEAKQYALTMDRNECQQRLLPQVVEDEEEPTTEWQKRLSDVRSTLGLQRMTSETVEVKPPEEVKNPSASAAQIDISQVQRWIVRREHKADSKRFRRVSMDMQTHDDQTLFLMQRCVLPNGAVRARWDVLVALLVMYSVTVIPYRIGFNQYATGGMFILEAFMDILFGFDIILNFRTAHYAEDGSLVTSSWPLARRYLRGWFLLDLVATVPFDLLAQLAGQDPSAIRSIKLVRILRLARLLKLVQFSKWIDYLENELELFNPAVIKISKLLFQVTLIAHLMSCGWYFISYNEGDEPCVDPCAIGSGVNSEGECTELFECNWWIMDGLIDNPTIGSHYIASTYWAFTTMTTVGYGDIRGGTSSEQLYSVFSMLVGVTVFGYVIGSMSGLVSKISEPGQRQREKLEE
eukprot:gene8696-10318_t